MKMKGNVPMNKISAKIKRSAAFLLAVSSLFLFGCGKTGGRATSDEKISKDSEIVLDNVPNESDAIPPDKEIVHFAAAGDNIIHEAVFTDAKNVASVYASETGKKVEYRFADMYEGVADVIKGADLAYVNHETPVAGKSFGISGYPDFNAPEEIGDDLAEVGFDIINIANNHMLDMGAKGYENSIKYWKEKGEEKNLTVIGGYTKSDYDNIRYVTANGIKIALLSYTTLINYGHKNDIPAGSDLIIPYANESDMRRQVALAKDGGADAIVVTMHWGIEDDFKPNAEQKKYAKILADLGVDVILGSHSHTLQPVEWIEGENGNKTLCAYSLGNLISTMYYSYYMVGGILTFDLVKTEDGVSVENPILVPTMCYYSMTRDSLKIYKLEDFTDGLVASHGSQLKGKFTMNTLYGYVKDTIDKEFLTDKFK